MSKRTAIALCLFAAFALAQDFGAATPHLQSGVQKMRARDFEGAEEDFTKAIDAAPDQPVCYLMRAQVRLNLGKHREAREDCDRAIDIDGSARGAYSLRGRVRMALEDYKGAIEDFDAAITTNPGDVGALMERGAARQQLQRYEGAIADFTKVIETSPQGAGQAHYRRGLVREMVGDYAAAIEDYNAVLAMNAEWGMGYYNRAQCKEAMGDTKGALEDFEVAIYCDEDNPSFYHARGRLRARLGDAEQAEADFAKAHELAPSDPGALFDRARYFFDSGKFKEARQALTDSIAGDETPGDREYKHLYLCLVNMMLGQKDEGVAGLAKFLDAREKKGDWFENVAKFLTGKMTEEEFLAAAKDENKHREREHLCEAYWYVGAVHLAAGDTAKAKDYFEKCVATKTTRFIEYESARMALKRLTAG
jgi:tetratricopeptide (TPR) repeat protein